MGTHMLPGRARWRAMRLSIPFTMAVILAIPAVSLVVMWLFAGVTFGRAIAGHSQAALHGAVLIRIGLAAAVGLVAVLVSALVMGWFAHRLTRDLARMEMAARRFADQQLPQLVERLRRGEQVDPASDLPPPARVKVTEVARAAGALASVQRTAVAAATTETSMRSGISQVFVSLARRSQSLLQRQLRLLDDLERKAVDPGALADLFPLDHLTTRMRRHAEGLIILSGSVPGRAWSSPVPVIDVIRGAIAEVEDYRRIAVVTDAADMVAGSAVADMIHLLAELIENAALFSPSSTRVEVRADRVGNGFAFEVEDRGLGIKHEELDAINERLGSPTDFDLADADQLGLFVVAKLAARHGVRVFLRPSPYGGITAIVLMPRSMITSGGEAPAQTAHGAAEADRVEEVELAVTGRQMWRTSPAEDTASAQPTTSNEPVVSQRQPALLRQPVFSRPPAFAEPEAGRGLQDTSPRLRAFPPQPASPGQGDSHGKPPAASAQPGLAAQPGTSPAEPAPIADSRPSAGQPAAGTHRGLPRRVRQASLSPHLRDSSPSAAARAPAHGPAVRSPEQAQSLLSSLQRGWERGRQAEIPDSEASEGSQNGAGNAREASQEDA